MSNARHPPQVRDRSIRLFRFLYEVEKFRAKRFHNLAAYGATTPPGAVIWLAGLPNHPEVRSAVAGTLDPAGDIVLDLHRTELPARPDVPPQLAASVANVDSTDPSDPPTLRHDRDDLPDGIEDHFARWTVQWRAWVAEVERLRPVRELYRRLFRLYEQIDQNPEDLEVVVAAGCLSWQPHEHAAVQRHLITMQAELTFDAESGTIALRAAAARRYALELDMLDPKRHPRPSLVAQAQDALAEFDTSLADSEAVGPILKTITHGLSDEAAYDGDADRPGPISRRAHVTFAPALIVRRPSNERKLRVLAAIIDALQDQGNDVPDGVASIVAPIDLDADQPQLDPAVDLDQAGSYLPLAANRAQQEIVWSVEHRRHTVVQGPPGTGKTHTIANVLSHLLATGKRVLITAHTERALKEVRGKLPADLRDLAIAVTGQGRDEKALLERSVRQMTAHVDSYQSAAARNEIAELERDIDAARRRQAQIQNDLVTARATEVETTTIGAFTGTTAEIAQQLADLADTYSWIDSAPPADPPLSRSDAMALLALLRRADLEQRAAEIDQPLDGLDRLPEPDTFAVQVEQAAASAERADGAARHRQHHAHAALAACDDDTRRDLAAELRAVAGDVGVLQRRPEPWVHQLVADLAAGKPGTWEKRAADLETTLTAADDLIGKVATASVRVPDGADLDRLCAQAQGLVEHLRGGGKVGRLIKAKPVRDAAELLDQVLVDGATVVHLERADTFVSWCLAGRHLDRADTLWPSTVDIPAENTFGERLAWHQTELQVLVEALATGKRLSDLHHNLNRARVPQPDFNDTSDIVALADVADEPDLHNAAASSARPLDMLAATLAGQTGPLRQRLHDAVRDRDVATYRSAVERHAEIIVLRELRHERDRLLADLHTALPATAGRLAADPHGHDWDDRLNELAAGCAWGFARSQLRHRLAGDHTDELLAELDQTTRHLQQTVLLQTVARAWSHAVERLDPAQRQRLNRYALLAKRLPQSGKYRARKLREVQDALRLCRDAVPAWIMPINYVADVLQVDPDAFDVVIVDEASQAGMDATFLQYLAPKMIVIGDDLQVSPTSFVDRDELHRLADDLLSDFEDKPLWADPETSLFDHANSRFGKRITLVEHFRCMPEIIGFSQRFIYERNGVNLIPLRQYGAERLAPIRTLHVTDGYRTRKVNLPEIDAIVELIAKCDVDPAYETRGLDGQVRKRTFGVISLTGADQAKLIEQALIDRLGEQAYAERDLRCGDAADFQGSQREVIFLSLVDAPAEDSSRIRKRGDKSTEQRINVAASRAQDQMWLVHSVAPEHLHPDDIRHQLLAYCLSTERQYGTSRHAVPHRVDDHTLDPDRFDSLFEQRVFNRIVDRGYAVQPQLNVSGYRIDLVVVGRETKLAVECDGDRWHGPDRYAADITRQRDLERAGWSFFRVRESQFYADREGALEPLWELLDSHGIAPVDQDPPPLPHEPSAGLPAGGPPSGEASVRPDDVDSTPAGPQGAAGSSDPHVLEQAAAAGDHTAVAENHSQLERTPVAGPTVVGDDRDDDVEDTEVRPAGATSHGTEETPEPKLDPVAQIAAVYTTPAPYRTWDTSIRLPHPANASDKARRDAIVRIVEVEGPVLGDRLYHLYIRSRGGTRVGTGIRQALDRFTRQLEASGDLLGADPLDEGGQAARTFRLAGQPPFVVRELGARTLHDIPPLELAARVHALRLPGEDDERTFRRVLKHYGLSNLTAKTRQRLEACSELARQHLD